MDVLKQLLPCIHFSKVLISHLFVLFALNVCGIVLQNKTRAKQPKKKNNLNEIRVIRMLPGLGFIIILNNSIFNVFEMEQKVIFIVEIC